MSVTLLKATTIKLHDLILTFQTNHPPLQRRFEAIYGHLPRATGSQTDIRIEWQLHRDSLAPGPEPGWSLISEGEQVSYYANGKLVAIRMPKYGLIEVDLVREELRGQVTPNCLSVYGAFEDVLMISLAPLYRRRGWYPLHAFAARPPTGPVALITGEMGAGKTTTGLALLTAGWKLLSNDSPLLTMVGEAVQVLAYPGRLSAYDDSLARFEQLSRFIPDQSPAGPGTSRQKRVFRAEEAFVEPWVDRGIAGAVFFPQVVPGLAQSELRPVPPAEAVLYLMPQAIEGWDKAAIGQSLAVLKQLVEQVPCYSLQLSPRVHQLPELLATGLASAG